MCARYSIALSHEALQEHFRVDEFEHFVPRVNVAPTEFVPSVRLDTAGRAQLEMMKWGLAPRWATHGRAKAPLINSRSETVFEKSTFKNAIRERRCILPASGFFEWRAEGDKKQPYYIHLAKRTPLGFASMFEWQADAIAGCAILTKASSGQLESLHDRMPVVLCSSDYGQWLDPGSDEEKIAQLINRSIPAEQFSFFAVTRRMSKAGYQGDDAVLPYDTGSITGGLFH